MAQDDISGLYPWGGDIRLGNPRASVAVVTLAEDYSFDTDKVAVWGHLKTENLGIEKIVANVISNPAIRVLVLCGREIRGHRSGDALRALHKNGVDGDGKIRGSRGAVPYIENLSAEAIARFAAQVELVDLLDVVDEAKIRTAVDEADARRLPVFGEPYIAKAAPHASAAGGAPGLEGAAALHRTIVVDVYGGIGPMAKESDVSVHRSLLTDPYGSVGAA